MTDTIIKNVRMLINNRITEVNILINDSKIEKISKIVSINAVDNIINGRGDLALPSGIDVHVHFRDMKEKHKEDWYTGSCAAAAGGITTVVDHPNTQPPTLNKKSFYQKLIKARSKSVIDFGLNGGVESENTGELTELWNLGVTAFGEIFGSQNFSEALDKIKRLGAVACIHAEDETINKKLMEKYKNNHNPGVHSLIRPPESEEAAVAALLKKQLTLHFCHISTKNAVNLIRSAKEEGENFTCEVTPHHLFLSTKSWGRLGSRGKMNPPLREPCHIPPLWEALNDHTIDMIASDHAPHTIEEKNTDIYDAPPGVPGVETLLPLMLEAAKHNHITLKRLVEVTRLNPAKRFGFDAHNKGDIKKGFDADIIIVNTSNTTPIRGEKLHSKAGWTPFEGTPALFPRLTLLRGRVIWDEGITVKKGYGNHCLRNASYGENDNTY